MVINFDDFDFSIGIKLNDILKKRIEKVVLKNTDKLFEKEEFYLELDDLIIIGHVENGVVYIIEVHEVAVKFDDTKDGL